MSNVKDHYFSKLVSFALQSHTGKMYHTYSRGRGTNNKRENKKKKQQLHIINKRQKKTMAYDKSRDRTTTYTHTPAVQSFIQILSRENTLFKLEPCTINYTFENLSQTKKYGVFHRDLIYKNSSHVLITEYWSVEDGKVRVALFYIQKGVDYICAERERLEGEGRLLYIRIKGHK